jgi:Flp pilus assembly pilin Flp
MVYLSRAFRFLSLHEEEGQALVEYAFILVLVSIAAVGLLATIGGYPHAVFSEINAHL